MKRKLVKQGAATLMVSIPSKWAKKLNLDKGDEIEVEEKGKQLILSLDSKSSKKKETIIEINEQNKHDLYPILTHAYRKGFHKIILKGQMSSYSREIRHITSNLLLGFEVTEFSSEKCVVEEISEASEGKYEVMMKKIFTIIKESQEMIIEDFKKGTFKDLQEIEDTRNQNDKFLLFCRRMITLGNFEGNPVSEWELLTFLMHIQHAYCYLHKYASKHKIKHEKLMIELLEELKKYFALFENAYYIKDIKSIHKINEQKHKFHFGKCLEAIEKANGKSSVVYSYIKDIFRLIQIGTSPILAELIEKNLE